MEGIRPGWLYGWKDIAAYIGCTDTTAQNYCKKYGLPVSRLPNGKPTAHPSRIDIWIEKVKFFPKRP